ncbi:MAG TPA: serine hydrolase domain-containing protein [Parafilimonas sp.]|nr:serine hydrolase domain-containing protein [Parafilimonas sp.]
MKKAVLLQVFMLGALILFAQSSDGNKNNCNLGVSINANYPKAITLDTIMKRYTTEALPGAAIAIYSETDGWWADAVGYANREEKIPMENCHLQYIQSVSKTYMAVEILQLKEQGKIKLDDPITNYLPARYSKYIKGATQITVRMLLNQNSGVPEYNDNPKFVSQVVQHPLEYFTADDCLKAIENEEPQFAPGAKYKYTNTNYLLLSLIGDAITGDHAAYIREHIFKPLDLSNSYYALDHNYLNGLNLPASYWDILNAGKPADITEFQKETVASSKGDDGIVCTPVDAVKFFKGLMEGKLLNEESMKQMFDFVTDEKGNKRYGMGMIYFDLGGIPAYGHGGGGLGAGCVLAYIPSAKLYMFIATNLGVLVDNDTSKKADDMKNEVLMALLQ